MFNVHAIYYEEIPQITLPLFFNDELKHSLPQDFSNYSSKLNYMFSLSPGPYSNRDPEIGSPYTK